MGRIKDIKESSDECNKALTDIKDEMNRNKSMQNDFQTSLDQARELFDQKIVKESERIDKLEATISSTKEYLDTKLGEADKTLSILVEERMKLIENAMEKSENVNEKNMQSLVDKFSNLEEDFEKKLASIKEKQSDTFETIDTLKHFDNAIQEKVKNLEHEVHDIEDKMQSISEYNKSITNSIERNETREKKLDDSMNAIMEQANATLINDAQQDAKIKLLESQNKSLEDKLTSLEAADLFLQESYRQLTDKTVKIEGDLRKSDEYLTSMCKQQQEEIDVKIKSQITDIHFDINEMQQERLGLNEKMEKMGGDMDKNSSDVEHLSNELTKYRRDIESSLNEKVSEARNANNDELEKVKDAINRDSDSRIRNIDDRLKEVMEEKTNLLINYETFKKETNEKFAYVENKNEICETQIQKIFTKTEETNNLFVEKFKEYDENIQTLKDIEGELSENINTLQKENKSSAQNIVSIQETLYIQNEQVKKSEKEKQEALAKMQENAEQQMANINNALSNLKNEINNEIMKIDLKIKQEKNKDISLINEKIVCIEKNVERNGKEVLQFSNTLENIDDTLDGLNSIYK